MRYALPILALLAACSSEGVLFVSAQGNALLILAPRADGVCNEARPTIRWTAVPGAVGYEVVVGDAPTGGRLLGHATTNGTEVQLDLPDGVAYVQVRVDSGGVLQASAPVRFRVIATPDWMPRMQVNVSEPGNQGGYKLFNLTANDIPVVLLVNEFAEILWWHRHGETGSLSDPRVLPNGNLLFYVRTRQEDGTRGGTAYEMTWEGQVVWQSRDGVDPHHEIAPGPGGRYTYLKWLFQDYQGVSYEGDGIEVFDQDTGQVIWEWSLFDHYDPADWQVAEVDDPGLSLRGVDWSHANSVVWDEARSLFWMSIRHFDQIIGIDYPSGDIRVVLGNLGLGGKALTSHQHAIEVQADGSLLFWNNGNHHDPQVSNARQVVFDEAAGTADIIWEWAPGLYDFAVGDADRLPNGNVLVTAGVTGKIFEVTPQGDKVWELESVGDAWIYRTQQVDEALIPDWVYPFSRPTG